VSPDELFQRISSLGPIEAHDFAGGFPHPDDPAIFCIPLADGRTSLIDAEDYPLVKAYPWATSGHRYVRTRHYFGGKVYSLLMHRIVMMLPHEGERVVDHINHDSLDNRKANLRVCTHQQNIFNSPISRASTSGVKGVWRNGKYRWTANVRKNGVNYGKSFRNKEDAAAWVREKRIELHGEFACHG
jgi:hypothetical protein